MGVQGRRRRIVVVDDDTAVLRTLQRQLDSLGWEAYPAGTGREALSMLHTLGGVEAVLTDVNMPIMDGLSLRREVDARFPETAVVLMSGEQDPSTPSLSDLPATTVLRKPFTVLALAAALDAACKDKEKE